MVVLALAGMSTSAAWASTPSDQALERMTSSELSAVKQREEVKKLRDERETPTLGKPITWTAIGGVLGLLTLLGTLASLIY